MLRVVFDTNVLVAALRSRRGASYQLVKKIGAGEWELNISVALALEYEDVLKRKGMLPADITEKDVDDFLNYVFAASNLLPFVMRRRPILPDPDDERILEVAVECGATIITHNIKDFAGAERFGVYVQTPGAFLRTLKETNER